MQDTPTIGATRRYLSIVRDGAPPNDEELARALDQLAIAYHEAPEGEPVDNEEEFPFCTHENYKKRYAEYGSRFPDHGYYAVADPTEPHTQEPLVADAIDDLADIARELEEVLWRFERFGADDAHWHFKFGFRSHWGMHLRQLSYYLHAKYW